MMSKNNTPTKKTKHKVWPLVLILLVLVAAAAVAVGVMGKDKEEEQPEPETVQEEDSGLEEGQVVYNGVTGTDITHPGSPITGMYVSPLSPR